MNKTSVIFNVKSLGDNIGDMMCSPLDYYSIPYSHKISWTCDIKFENSIIIFGGGGLFIKFKSFYFKNIKKNKNIIIGWGIGFNQHYENKNGIMLDHDLTLYQDFDLIGIRDFNIPNTEYVPCVSCKHSAFDIKYPIKEDIRIYEHMDYKIDIFPNQQRFINTYKRHTFKEVIEFLGSGNKIITNSYHGAYWGTLLGKQVFIYKPFSTRFKDMPYTKIIYNKEDITPIEVNPNFLQECRKRNDDFYQKVINLRIQNETSSV